MPRNSLPFRVNCEGYFLDRKRNILAKNSGKGYVIFPGGGVHMQETLEQGIIRETLEETGAIICSVRELHVLKVIWSKNWAKTAKQKKRYEQFQGDEMHFFKGEIKGFVEKPAREEDFWVGSKFMPIAEAIRIIEEGKRLNNGEVEYRETQLELLNKISGEQEMEKAFVKQLVKDAEKERVQRFVVGAVIMRGTDLLLLERPKDDFMGGIWELPSGKVEGGESLDVALYREVMEETGLHIRGITRYLGHFDYTSKSGKLTRQFNFAVTVKDNSVIKLTEHQRFAWMKQEELELYPVTEDVLKVLRVCWENV